MDQTAAPIVNIPLTVDQINLVLGSLGRLPFADVEGTIQHIRNTAIAALNAARQTADAQPAADQTPTE